jgi:hypothetical protein
MQSIERRRAERFNLGIRLSVSVLNSTAPKSLGGTACDSPRASLLEILHGRSK